MSNDRKNIVVGAIQWLFQPNSNINYSVISLMYAFGSLLFIILYIFDQWASSQLARESSTKEQNASSPLIKELHSSLEGIHLVFSPFFPCLLWSLILLRNSSRAHRDEAEEVAQKKNDWDTNFKSFLLFKWETPPEELNEERI